MIVDPAPPHVAGVATLFRPEKRTSTPGHVPFGEALGSSTRRVCFPDRGPTQELQRPARPTKLGGRRVRLGAEGDGSCGRGHTVCHERALRPRRGELFAISFFFPCNNT